MKNSIKQHQHEKKSLEDEINPFVLYVKRIDEENKLKEVKEFLDKQKEKIDPDNPPTIDELYKTASESDDFNEIDKNMLTQEFNTEFLDSVREFKSIHPLSRRMSDISNSIISFPNKMRWEKYEKYSDLISKQKPRIDYFKKLIDDKESELNSLIDFEVIRKGFLLILFLVTCLVFLPLSLLLYNYDSMSKWIIPCLFILLFGWTVLCYVLYKILKKQLKDSKRDE